MNLAFEAERAGLNALLPGQNITFVSHVCSPVNLGYYFLCKIVIKEMEYCMNTPSKLSGIL